MPSERSGEVSPGGHASHSPRSARLYRPAVQTEQPVLNHWLSFPLSARLSLALLEVCNPGTSDNRAAYSGHSMQLVSV